MRVENTLLWETWKRWIEAVLELRKVYPIHRMSSFPAENCKCLACEKKRVVNHRYEQYQQIVNFPFRVFDCGIHCR